MVSMNFGLMALQMTQRGEHGKLVGIDDGRYITVPLETVISGKRHVDVDKYYDIERYRPKVGEVLGLPMFLH
jgi:6-phosphofructokinase 1